MLAPLIGVVSCGYSLERETAKWEHAKRQVADVLRERGDPDSLAAAGLLTARRAPADALILINRAVAAAPERPELVWLQIRICVETEGCDPKPIEMRLRELEPENAIAWFGDLTRAFEVEDPLALDAALVAAGRTKRADSHYTILTARLGKVAMDSGASPQPDAAMLVLGEVGGIGLPHYMAATKGCGVERLDRDDVREACRSLAAALMAGDNVLAEMIGVAIAKRAWPSDSPEWQAASEARRAYQYRSEVLREKVWIDMSDEAMTIRYLDLSAQHRREQDVIVAQLMAAGIDPNPPPEWVDKPPP